VLWVGGDLSSDEGEWLYVGDGIGIVVMLSYTLYLYTLYMCDMVMLMKDTNILL
jgi:hypothetical protein